MDLDTSEEESPAVNLTACLILHQRSDERLSFDFVTFPGDETVLGVVDLKEGAHFIYIKKEDNNDEIDTRVGEFVYIEDGSCLVLKRSKTDDGPLFVKADADETRSYHSALVAGHFANKVAKVPQQLKELWWQLTSYISEDVIKALRPLQRTVSSKSKYVKHSNRTEDMAEDHSRKQQLEKCEASEGNPDSLASFPPSDRVTYKAKEHLSTEDGRNEILIDNEETVLNEDLGTKNVSHMNLSTTEECTSSFFSLGTEEDDTADDYRSIAMQFKGSKNADRTYVELFGGTKDPDGNEATTGSDSMDHENSGHRSKLKDRIRHAASDPKEHNAGTMTTWEEPAIDAEATTNEPCTIYYSDLGRINRKMSLLNGMTPSSVTKLHLDTTHILEAIAANHRRYIGQLPSQVKVSTDIDSLKESEPRYQAAIGEYQYAFCIFLLNYHYDSFEHWKAIFRAICGAETFFLSSPQLAIKVLTTIKLQLETFESDLYEPDNFFAYYLSSLEEIINDNQPQLLTLVQPFNAIKESFKLKFGISFEDAKILQDNVQIVDEDDLLIPADLVEPRVIDRA